MRTVTIRAVSQRARVLHFRFIDLLCLVGVASDAKVLRRGLRQNDLAVFRWLVAEIALLFTEGRVNERLHQIRTLRLMWVMACQAIRIFERLVLVRFCEIAVLDVMAIEAKRRNRLGQVELEFAIWAVAGLVRDVAGIAADVERCVAASLVGNIQPLGMAIEAEVFLRASRGRLQEVIRVVGRVRIVALQAVANRRRMHGPLDFGCVLIGVTGETKCVRSRGDQLYARHIFVDSHLVARRASHRHR